MDYKYKALFKYEFKKIVWLFGAMFLFMLLYAVSHNNMVSSEINSILSYDDSLSIDFLIFEPCFLFFYTAFIYVLVYLQFNDGFNKLWHSLPFTNKDVICIKLLTGIFAILIFFLCIFIIMTMTYLNYAEVYKDVLTALNINPNIISIFYILKTVITIFSVYIFIYFFTVFIQYIVGNCLSGIVLSLLLSYAPILLLTGFNALHILSDNVIKLIFLVFPHYYDVTNDLFYSSYNQIENLQIYVANNIVSRFPAAGIFYYIILALISLFLVFKVAASSKWIEHSNPFSKKWIVNIFKLAFVIDFAMIGAALSYDNIFERILLSLVLALIGYVIAVIIIKRQGVNS